MTMIDGSGPVRVLVIDDDEVVRNVLVRTLRREGFEVLAAADGRAGVAAVRDLPVDLVVTDIFMPEQDGIQTIIQLRREFPAVKIIAMSGGGQRYEGDMLHPAARLGAARTLSKPFTPAELVAVVRGVLASESPSAPAY